MEGYRPTRMVRMLFLYHLRELFRRVRDGAPFDSGNAARLRWMGGLIIAAHVLFALAEIFNRGAALEDEQSLVV